MDKARKGPDIARSAGITRRGRREVLSALALALGAPIRGQAAILHGALLWMLEQTQPPQPVSSSSWRYFTADEAGTVEALVDHLIPPDPAFAGGKDAGCAVFIDRQLAGPTAFRRARIRPVLSTMGRSKGPNHRSTPGTTTAKRWRHSTNIAARAKAASIGYSRA
jgi:gluconate 2-dehydrogenase gamma chain